MNVIKNYLSKIGKKGGEARSESKTKAARLNAKMPRKTKTIEERFWAKVDRCGANECWEWKASLHPKGYGQMNINGKPVASHRITWRLTHGSINKAQMICHKCDNRSCCNPGHLFEGTASDNTKDMISKARHTHGQRSRNAKLTDRRVLFLRSERAKGKSFFHFAKDWAIGWPTIYKAAVGQTWKHLKTQNPSEQIYYELETV